MHRKSSSTFVIYLLGLFLPVLFSLSCSQSPQPKGSESNPSRAETIEYLTNKLNGNWNPQLISTVSYYDATVNVSFQDCMMTVVHHRSPGSLNEKKFQWVAPLAKLDPNQVEIRVMPGDPLSLGRERTIVIKTTNGDPCVSLNDAIEKDHVDIVIRPDGEDAQKIAKAFRHLIQSCGGKKDLF